MTDCTTARGWLHQSNFCEVDKLDVQVCIKHKVSCKHTYALINNNILGYVQWFPGNKNEVGNSLLRYHHLTDTHLTSFLSSSIHNQMPDNF